MSKAEIMEGLAKLSPAERQEVSRRLVELDEASADQLAESRSAELAGGSVRPKSQAEVFGNARAALQ